MSKQEVNPFAVEVSIELKPFRIRRNEYNHDLIEIMLQSGKFVALCALNDLTTKCREQVELMLKSQDEIGGKDE